MYEAAYIAIAEDGHVTLFWGDGTEEKKVVIMRGARPSGGRELVDAIESMKVWAEENGYVVVVPAYDLHAPDFEIEVSEQEVEDIDLDEVDDLLDDLYFAGDYNGDNPGEAGYPDDSGDADLYEDPQ
jgi:hypothetical protein